MSAIKELLAAMLDMDLAINARFLEGGCILHLALMALCSTVPPTASCDAAALLLANITFRIR